MSVWSAVAAATAFPAGRQGKAAAVAAALQTQFGDAQGLGTMTNDDAALAEQQIPTLSEWSLIALGALLAALAMAKMR